MRDVVIVGAGHNALVAACYLAREGLDVEVVERREVAGGAVSTVERFPGHRIDVGSSIHIMVRTTGIAEDLRLDQCGLAYVDLDPWAFAPFGPAGEQVALTFSADLDATCAGIEAVCGERDAVAYRRFVDDWAPRAERVLAAMAGPPSGRHLASTMWGLGRGTGLSGRELASRFLATGDALLDSYFTDERLKAALGWLGSQAGPPPSSVGSAVLVGWNALLHRHLPGRAIGGSGALSQALATRLRRSGGILRLGDGAERITSRAGRATGVRTVAGEQIDARAVLAGCHVLTALDLVGAQALPGDLADRAYRRIPVGNGIGMVVRVRAAALPRYPAADGAGGAWHGLQLLARSRAQLRSAYGDYHAGRIPAEPAALVLTPTAVDGSLAPAGEHGVTVWGQWHPYALADRSSWDDVGAGAAEGLLAQVEAAAPGFRDGILDVHVQTPLDLERELGLRRGNVMHVEMTLDAMFGFRPLPELSGYRGPLAGMYLTGASTHPGGGVFGASGRTAARVLLADRRRPVWARAAGPIRRRRAGPPGPPR